MGEQVFTDDNAGIQGFSAESIRAQLKRILGSQTFSSAPMLSRLLAHVVEQTLSSNGNRLKEYSLGVEVFDRGESFDPRSDTIVRVQARRLRAKLRGFYEVEGRADPIIIELPKGHYVPVFQLGAVRRQPPALDLVRDFDSFRELMGATTGPRIPLPAPRTSLIGREQELLAVKNLLLNENVRLVTLTGAGGSGKTRLAIQAATELSGDFPGGIYFVTLASIADPAMVASAIAQIVGVRHTGGRPLVNALRDHLYGSAHGPTLLFVDNFEHLLAAASLLVELLEACAPLKVLVTSRAVLHVYGEHEYPVPPLAAPDPQHLPPLDQLSKNPAVQLFVQRAAAASPSFGLNEENAAAVAEVCSRLDGLPLAIELAAARVKMLPPAAMLTRLDSRLDLLTGGARDLPARQQTLRNTIEWSYTLLTLPEQKLFRRLSVLAGGSTLESAEAVCNTRRDLELDVLEGISSLVDKSLLQRVEHNPAEPRFMMLETIREYALERLGESGDEMATRRAQAAYCLVVAEEGNRQLTEKQRADWLRLCADEHDNFRAALDWLVETDNGEWALRLGLALYGFWERQEHLAEGRKRLEAVLSMPSAALPTRERAKVLAYAGSLAYDDLEAAGRLTRESLDIYSALGNRKGIAGQLNSLGTNLRVQGDWAAARPMFEQCLLICRELNDRTAIAAALSNLADTVSAQGEHALATSLLEESLSIFRDLGDETGVAWSLNHLGDVRRVQGDFTEARRLYEKGAEAFRRAGDRWGLGRSFSDIAYIALEQNDHEAAHFFFEQALRIFADLGHKRGICKTLEGFACLAVREQDHGRALMLAGAAEALRHRLGVPARPLERARLESLLEPGRHHRDPASAKAIWMAGWKMPLEQAIQYAIRRNAAGSTGN